VIAALKNLIATWPRVAIFEAMNGGERDQRLWFIVDELDALGQIDGLKDALARLRKFGGRCVLGFQSIAQVSSTYGQGEAQTIVENCGNTLILRCSASEGGGTARFASRLIGEREILRIHESRSARPGTASVENPERTTRHRIRRAAERNRTAPGLGGVSETRVLNELEARKYI
jgi:type IV secretory pathway TraG/TraD family ATPase VirD4